MQDLSLAAAAGTAPKHFYAVIDYGDTFVQPLILAALAARLPKGSYTLLPPGGAPPNAADPVLYIQQYEALPFEAQHAHASSTLANAYVIRKALIRKHYLATTAENWAAKHPASALATHIKPTVAFEVDYAEFLDDALLEAWELHEAFARNADRPPHEADWWILKPGMSDRGQGIRLFDSELALQEIFEQWEAERPDSDDEEEEDEGEADETASPSHDGTPATPKDSAIEYIMTSQLRHFVAQPYIHPPLLLRGNPHKFHIRTYVLAVGALKVYVYRPMLALFAGTPYAAPWASTSASSSDDGASGPDLRAHLTNTCLQDGTRDGAVQAFWALGDGAAAGLGEAWREDVFGQICAATGELFEAAARGMGVHFQTLPNAFEVFGLDFVVDAAGTAWLLEVNAFPDFGQTGEVLGEAVVGGLWEGVVEVAVKPFFGGEGGEGGDMVLVKDLDMGRR